MNIRIHSADMNRIMKIINQCIDNIYENVEVIHDNNLLTVRGTNNIASAVVSTPLLGGDGSSFCVDGAMLTRVCAACRGDIEISADGKVCTVKGAGRTRLPIVPKKVPAFTPVTGKSMTIQGADLTGCYGKVSYAVSTNQARVNLTGVSIKAENGQVKFAALDGFQLAVENTKCGGDDVKMLIPGAFMKIVCNSVLFDDEVKITTDGKRVQVTTEDLMMNCALLADSFPDYERMLPQEFKTEALVNIDAVKDALKSGSVVQSKDSAVRVQVAESAMRFRNNSEHADFEADVPCETQGEEMNIAFNDRYLMSALSMIDGDEAIIKLSGITSPVIVQGKESDGIHLLLPVRIQAV